jgi:HAMP domain-containing protein
MVLDFAYPIDDFQRSARFIAISFFIISALSLAGALLLTVNRVRRLTRPIRRLANAADQIAAGQRDIVVSVGTRDDVGRLAQSFNDMATALKWNEGALQRKIAEMTALYEIGQEISAQVSLEPTLDLIVKRRSHASQVRHQHAGLARIKADEFAIRAQTGAGSATVAGTRFRKEKGSVDEWSRAVSRSWSATISGNIQICFFPRNHQTNLNEILRCRSRSDDRDRRSVCHECDPTSSRMKTWSCSVP